MRCVSMLNCFSQLKAASRARPSVWDSGTEGGVLVAGVTYRCNKNQVMLFQHCMPLGRGGDGVFVAEINEQAVWDRGIVIRRDISFERQGGEIVILVGIGFESAGDFLWCA